MSKFYLSCEFDSEQELRDFLAVCVPTEPIPEPEPDPEPVPEPNPEPEPQAMEVPVEEVPIKVDIAFDLGLTKPEALPLKVKKGWVIGLKVDKVQGWAWRMVNAKNVKKLPVPLLDFIIVTCLQANTETYATFELFNPTEVGTKHYITFAVAES